MGKTAALKSITRYYFHKLSLQKTDQPIKFDQFVFGADFVNLSRSEATGMLCETFIRCTRKEAEWLARNQQLHSYFKDVMVILFEIVRNCQNNSNSLNCVRHCMQSYIKVVLVSRIVFSLISFCNFQFIIVFLIQIKDCIATRATTSTDQTDLINQQFRIFTSMQMVPIYDELLMNAYPMLLALMERFRDNVKPSKTEFRNSIVALADCEAKTILLTRFETIFE